MSLTPCLISTILLARAIASGHTQHTQPREIHVAKSGSNSDSGTLNRPYLTIGKAADVALPGDTVTVHAGTYREWVTPVRGGSGEQKRIIYRAAEGEAVFIKGSEQVSSWKRESKAVWKAEIDNTFFGDYNPYALRVSGGWLNYGGWHHRGDVYLNGKAFREMKTAEEVTAARGTWHCSTNGNTTVIRANFGNDNPNSALTEINVRECLFMPTATGLDYITVRGFQFMHAAANWAPPVIKLQTGAVGPRMGKHWIIENCTITNARCVGIILGQAPGVDYTDIDAYGDHIVRNNIIRGCGQAGIAGQKGATRSVISGNLIENTNIRREFGGWETAAVKFHNSVDTVIAGNVIRGVYRQEQGAFGIWIDFGNQGIRITGNIIYNTEAAPLFLEMNHGPSLVDNNILIGNDVRSNSEATVFAHNLFVDCGYEYRPDTKRRSAYFKPHTTKPAGRKTGTAQDDKWFNNIFIRKGLEDVDPARGYEANCNVFLEGAEKSTFGDSESLQDTLPAEFKIRDFPLGATVTFRVPDAAADLAAPRIDASLFGAFPTVGQKIEDRYGNPTTVNEDINGNAFPRPLPGPLATLKPGQNTISKEINPD